MEENTQLPKEVVEEIKQKAEDFANSHINGRSLPELWDAVFKANEAGAIAYATKLHQMEQDLNEFKLFARKLTEERDELRQWKMEAVELQIPIIAYVHKHLERNIGDSCTALVIAELDRLREENATLKAQPGAVWVKASEFKYEVGMAYHAKDSKSKGAGSFDDFGNFFWGDGSFTAGENQDDLLVLDESAAGREDAVAVVVDDWIDVNERLPEDNNDNSVYCIVYDAYWGVVVRPYNQAHECWDGEDGDDYYTDAKGGKITHWKPLPQSPFKQQKEK